MKRFFGGLLLAVGWLVAVTTGLCTGYFFLLFLLPTNGPATESLLLLLPLIIGGIPFLIGLALIWIGRRLLREKPNDPDIFT